MNLALRHYQGRRKMPSRRRKIRCLACCLVLDEAARSVISEYL
jgi:hypothetical protein